MLTKSTTRNRTLAFRLSETEYMLLVRLAKRERRKLAEMVHLLVVDSLSQHTTPLLDLRPPTVSSEE